MTFSKPYQQLYHLERSIQQQVEALWPQVTTENIDELTDFAGYKEDFLKLFGFGFDAVDYDAEVEPELAIAGLVD